MEDHGHMLTSPSGLEAVSLYENYDEFYPPTSSSVGAYTNHHEPLTPAYSGSEFYASPNSTNSLDFAHQQHGGDSTPFYTTGEPANPGGLTEIGSLGEHHPHPGYLSPGDGQTHVALDPVTGRALEVQGHQQYSHDYGMAVDNNNQGLLQQVHTGKPISPPSSMLIPSYAEGYANFI